MIMNVQVGEATIQALKSCLWLKYMKKPLDTPDMYMNDWVHHGQIFGRT